MGEIAVPATLRIGPRLHRNICAKRQITVPGRRNHRLTHSQKE